MDSISFSVEAMVRGYHVYRDIWIAAVGEVLPCEREPTNTVDCFAVAVKNGLDIVGHVPKKISSICSVFLHRGGTIDCHITGCRRYSADLIQGGLEVPCHLIFTGDSKYSLKAQKLIESALIQAPVSSKKPKLDDNSIKFDDPNVTDSTFENSMVCASI